MIVIDENADTVLHKTLEHHKLHPDASRFIRFQFSLGEWNEVLRTAIVTNANRFLPDTETALYFCADQSVFVLAKDLPRTEANQFMLAVAAHVGHPATPPFVEYQELQRHIHRFLIAFDAQIEQRRALAEAARIEQEKQAAARKRHEILNAGLLVDPSTITQRRANREAPELMIVEDDAFSRRLVENVLQKRYALTSLSDAEKALSSYTMIAPDILFLDINLPDVTGHELLDALLKIDPNAYIIMLSGNADRDNIMQAMNRGAKGFIAKPFTRDKLFQYIERCPTIKTPII